MLNPEAYSEYAALVLKHFDYEPSTREIKPEADTLIVLLQMILEKEAARSGGESVNDN